MIDSSQQQGVAVANTATPAPSPSAQRALSSTRRWLRTALALVLCLAAAFLALRQTPWYQERRLQSLSLAELQRERADRGDTNARLLYYLGRRLNEQERFADADPVLRKAVGLDPDSPRLRDEWARALVGSGLITAAFGELRQFAGTHPNSAPAHLLLGKFYVAQNSMNRAVEELSRAVQIDPSLREGWSYLVAAYDSLRNYPQANAAAEKAAALRPNDFTSQLHLATEKAHLNDVDGALLGFARAVELDPGSALAHREYARWLLHAGAQRANLDRAIGEARRAAEITPQDAEAQMLLGSALQQHGDLAAAAGPLQRAAELAAHAPAPALALAQVLDRLGHASEGHAWMEAYRSRQQRYDFKAKLRARLELNAKDVPTQRRFARLLAEEGDVEGCQRHHAAALNRPPDSPPVLTAAAQDLADTGHEKEALRLVKRALEIAPHSPEALETMGNALLAAGQPRDAAVYYDKARAYHPERFQMYCDRIAKYFREQRQRAAAQLPPAERAYRASRDLVHGQVGPLHIGPEAIRLAQQAASLEPQNPKYLRYLLMLQFDKRRYDEAIETANRLLALAPQDTRAHALLAVMLVDHAVTPHDLEAVEQHLQIAATDPAAEATWRYGEGLVAMKRGDNTGAIREFQRALQLDPEPEVTYYKLAQAQMRAGQKKEAERNLAILHKRAAQEVQEGKALHELAVHPDDAARYRTTAALLDSHGRHAQAEAIREAARSRFGESIAGE